jgi:hypothetical protein
MASLSGRLAVAPLVTVAVAALVGGCSPEARRVRDGGPGADPGNRRLVERTHVDPKAADTTLWPGRAPAPVERLKAGTMYPPPPPVSLSPTPAAKSPSAREPRTFEKSAPGPSRQERR